MNKQALFCDGTQYYVIPEEPKANEKVVLRFRTAKDDVEAVNLIADSKSYPLYKESTTDTFDYYAIEWLLTANSFTYYFEIVKGDMICYFNRCGVAKEIMNYYNFEIVPDFSTPGWAKGAVMYQIFVDRFYNGDVGNDVENGEYIYIGQPCAKIKDWNQFPNKVGIREFYGGDLQGVLDKLDYLEDLGIEVVYFNPIFVSPSNHKYDVQDYDYVDPHYGKIVKDGGSVLPEYAKDNLGATKYQIRTTNLDNLEASNQLFVKLVNEIHKRGMKVILDGVFNHCGSFNKWMDCERLYESQDGYHKGAFVSSESPYRDFFKFSNEDPNAWPYNHHYDGWWGHYTLPKLNYEDSECLKQYILDIGKKWVSPPYNVDGWRLDVAADLGYSNEFNHLFWKEFRNVIKQANPNALILAEHYGDPGEWLHGDEWDTVMNYDAFMEPITWFLTGMEKHSDQERLDLCGDADVFVGTITHHMANMLTPSLQVAMNELSNHDHSRFLTRTNHKIGRVERLGPEAASVGVSCAVMRIAVVMQMTWVGAPTVYYGDEAGVCGFTDPDNRRTYPWGEENQELLQFHKAMIRIHKGSQALRIGSIHILTWKRDMIAYARFNDKEQIIVVINNRDLLEEVVVPVWKAEVPMKCKMERMIYSYADSFTMEKEEYIVENGELVINMGRFSALVLKTK
ncbi:MAG: glycoside hydrolase family 13 protein [Lachnospiraceae bacterium]